MQVGDSWAYREQAHDIDCPVIRAEIIQLGPRKSSKVRVRLHGGEYPGLDFWVPKIRLRVPWEETEAWLRDERALNAASLASAGTMKTLICQAADQVFAAYPRPDGIMLDWPSRTEAVYIREPEVVAADLGVAMADLLSDPLAFIDRKRVYHAPARVAERLAHLVIERYPEEVLKEVADDEAELEQGSIHGRTSLSGGDLVTYP